MVKKVERIVFDEIIVIDDDPKIFKSLRMILKQYKLIEFQDGRKAIEFLKKPREIYLALCDIYMKNMNGFDILTELQKNNKCISVIMMTAFGSKDNVVKALKGRADGFIEKPFNVAEVRDTVRSILKDRFGFYGLNTGDCS